MSEGNPNVKTVYQVTNTQNPSLSYLVTSGQPQPITNHVNVASTGVNPVAGASNNAGGDVAGTKDNVQWNIPPLENVEDKNPFSVFSEEHMSKLDEFLSSEEAKKILQQTTEGEFTKTMSELAAGTDEMPGEDMLKFDLLEGANTHSASLDHAYCIRSPTKQPLVLTQDPLTTPSSKVVVVTMPTVINYSPVLPMPTAVSAEMKTSSEGNIPRTSVAIQLKQGGEEEKEEEPKEQMHPGFVGAVHPGIVQPQHVPNMEMGRGRGRGRRSLLPEDRLDIRRSSRISDQEQRDLAEKIRQENLQREKEAMEEMKKKEEKDKTEATKKTTPRRGRPPKGQSDEDSGSAPRGVKSAVVRKGQKVETEDEEEDEEESEAEDSPPSKGKGSPRVSSRTNKGKKARRFLEESEKQEKSKKGQKASDNDSPTKWKKKKGGKKEASSSESDSEDEKPKKGTKIGKKKGKHAEESDSEDEEGIPKKGKKKGKRDEKDDKKSTLGRKKSAKGKDLDSDSATEIPKKGKKGEKKKGKAESESDSDDSDNESLAVKAKKHSGDSEDSKTPEKDKTKSAKADEAARSPRSIFKVMSSIEQPKLDDDFQTEQKIGELVNGKDVVETAGKSNALIDSKSSKQEVTIEFESRVEEMSYEEFLFTVGGEKEEDLKIVADSDVIKPGPSGEGNKHSEESNKLHFHKSKRERSDSISSDKKTGEDQSNHEQKVKKVVKKKMKKQDEIVVDPSVMDLFKPDIDTPVQSKKASAEAGCGGKEVSHSHKLSTESQNKEKDGSNKSAKSRDPEKVKRSRSSSEHRKSESDLHKHEDRHEDRHGEKHKTPNSHSTHYSHSSHKGERRDSHSEHKSSARKLSLEVDENKSEEEKSKTRDKTDLKAESEEVTPVNVTEQSNDDQISVAKEKDQNLSGQDKPTTDDSIPMEVTEDVKVEQSEVKSDLCDVHVDTKIKKMETEEDEGSGELVMDIEEKPKGKKEEKLEKEKSVKFEKVKKEGKKEHDKQVKSEKKRSHSVGNDKTDSRRFRREKSREQQKRVIEAVKKYEASDEEEEEEKEKEDSDADAEDDSDYEAPDEKYCICQQPYGKRFMICCDRCEQWYHGSCVGVSRSRGKEMEKNNEEYICPVCLGQVKKPEGTSLEKQSNQSNSSKEKSSPSAGKVIHKREDTAKKKEKVASIGDVKVTKEPDVKKSEERSTKKTDERRESTSKLGEISGHPKKHDGSTSKGHEKSLHRHHHSHKHRDIKKEGLHKHHKFGSDKHSMTKVKDMAAQRCVIPGCNKFAKRESVYCSTDHIYKHAKDSLKIIHKRDLELGRKSANVRRITVIEKKSGRVLSGPNAPLETILKTWLQQHPSFEVVKPRPRESSKSREREGRSPKQGQSPMQGQSPREGQSPKEKTTTVSTITVKREDIKERKEPVVTEKKEEKREEKKDGPDVVRLNVRKSLRDALINRSEGADDVMVSHNEIRTIALHIEEELFAFFGEASHKYKAKYRSLIFNIKDSRNQGLFRKVLNGHIKPHDLVRMTPEELASKELAKWREHETKHQLEMIEQVEKEHMNEKEHIVKKTHKGEIDLDEDLSTLEDKGVEKMKENKAEITDSDTEIMKSAEPTKSLVFDTTAQHKMHLFDLNCKICTGKIAPPQEETTPTKKVKVATNTSADDKKAGKSESRKTEEEQTKAEEVVKEVLKAISKAKADTPKADSTVTVRSPDSALQSGLEKPKFTPSSPMLWKGFIQMQDVAKFVTTAYRVSGPAEKLDIPDTIHVCGRIAPEQIWDYLAKMKMIGTKDIVILRFLPGSDEEKTAYINLYSYLNSRARCGVVGNKAKHTKDFYILPLASHSKIPSVLEPFDGPGLEENRPHMLLAIIVKQRTKRSSDAERHDGKKSKVETLKSKSGSKEAASYTPPPTGGKGKVKSYTPPKIKSILKKDSHKTAKTSSATSTPSSSSSTSTPGDTTPGTRPSQGSKDPIVQVYGEGGSLSEDSMDTTSAPPSAEDIPYDPEDDSQLPYKQARPAATKKVDTGSPKMVPPPDPLPTKTSDTTVPKMVPPPAQPVIASRQTVEAQPVASGKTVEAPTPLIPVDDLIKKIAKCANPADATAITVAAITELKTVHEKRKFLFDMTSCVEQQKKLLEESKSATLSARTLVSAIYAISAASKALIPLAKAAKAEAKAAQSGETSKTSASVPATESSVVTKSETSVSLATSSVTPVTSSVTTTTTVSEVKVTVSLTTVVSPQRSVSEGAIKPALSTSYKGSGDGKEVKAIKSVSFAEEVITTTIASDLRSAHESFEEPCDVDLRPKYVAPVSSQLNNTQVTFGEGYPVTSKEHAPYPVDVTRGTPMVPSVQQQPVNPPQMPEALKSLFSVIPGSDYSHVCNVKKSNIESADTIESYKTSSSGQLNVEKPQTSSQFNVKLLDFDYGDSDSDDDSPKISSKKSSILEEESESTVLPYEADIKKFEEEQTLLEKENASAEMDRDTELMPPPPPLPTAPASDELPPLPAEPPPPLPEHDPEEEEDEAQKKKKKKKPPPEIVLQPKDPVGKAILEATFMKLSAPVPPPPMPPMPLAPNSVPGGRGPNVMQVPPQNSLLGPPPKSLPGAPPPSILGTPPNSMPGTPVLPPNAMPGAPPVMPPTPPSITGGPIQAPPMPGVMVPPIPPPMGVPLPAPAPQMSGPPPMPMSGGIMAQSPSGMPVMQAGMDMSMTMTPGISGPISSVPPGQTSGQSLNPFTGRPVRRRRPQGQQSIPSLFDVEVTPTKDFTEEQAGEGQDSSSGWIEDEALTLPLEDQDFRKDQDFRSSEDVDERRWGRQKFPPPWAQDVDQRVDKTGQSHSAFPGSEVPESELFGENQGDVDYRNTNYPQPGQFDSSLGYTEDQDYRHSHNLHRGFRRKKRRWNRDDRGGPGRSGDRSYKRSRKFSEDDKDKTKNREKEEEHSDSKECAPLSRPHRIADEVTVPKPPPGVTSATNGKEKPPVTAGGTPPIPPGIEASGSRPPPPHVPRTQPARSQPAPPGVDDWN